MSTAVTQSFLHTSMEKKQAYVKESLTRALQEVKFANQERRQLQSVDDFLREIDEEQWSGK